MLLSQPEVHPNLTSQIQILKETIQHLKREKTEQEVCDGFKNKDFWNDV